jgi:hypothetical protein
MASKYFRTRHQQYEKRGLLQHHLKLLEQHYDFLKFSFEKNVLVCTGKIKSADFKHEYKIEIRCTVGAEPYSKIIEPEIVPSLHIHMYNDHSLCLHYPPDMKWSGSTPIYKYTIPWVLEWITFYELYLVNGGKWEGRESPAHFTEDEKNISEDLSEE